MNRKDLIPRVSDLIQPYVDIRLLGTDRGKNIDIASAKIIDLVEQSVARRLLSDEAQVAGFRTQTSGRPSKWEIQGLVARQLGALRYIGIELEDMADQMIANVEVVDLPDGIVRVGTPERGYMFINVGTEEAADDQ